MRRFPTTLVIVVLAIIGIVGGWRLFSGNETQRYQAVQHVRTQRSELHFGETIAHDKGPIAREEWRLDNVNGKSVASYTADSRFDAVSSGPISRNRSGLRAITSRRKVPSTLVASAVPVAGLGTDTA